MESVGKARARYRQYPLILSKCGKEATVYAQCVLKRDNVKINDCTEEFKLFKTCLQKTAASLKTRI